MGGSFCGPFGAVALGLGCMINPDYDGPRDGGDGSQTSSGSDGATLADDESASAESASAESATTEPVDTTGGPGCGNKIVEGIETCDDGNDVNGDGCNVDCVESGTQVWELAWDGGRQGWDAVHDLALLGDGSVVTAGITQTDAGVQAEQVRLDADGNETWRYRYSVVGAIDTDAWGAAPFLGGSLLAGTGDNETMFAVALDAGGALQDEYTGPGRVFDATGDGEEAWIVGRHVDETAALFHLSSELDLVATHDEATGSLPAASVAWAVAQNENRVVVVGETLAPNRAFVRELAKSDGGVAWEHDVIEIGGDADSGYGAAFSIGGAIATVGDVQFGSERNGWLMRRDTGGRLLDEIEQEDLGNYHGVAIGPSGEIAVAGWVDNGLGKLALLVKYAVDGSLAWRREVADVVVGENIAWTVVIRDDAVIVVAGSVFGEETNLDGWVAAYTP